MSDIEKQELVNNTDSKSGIEVKKFNIFNKNSFWDRWKSIHPCIRFLLIVLIIVPWIIVYLVFADFNFSGTSASIHYRDRCDGDFGCCKIYNHCEDKKTYLDGHSIKIDKLADDSLNSNCPSLEDLVDTYNRNYFPKNKDCGEFGCCDSVDITCDNAIRNTFIIGNNHGAVELFRESRKIVPVLNPKKDAEGSNCDRYGTIYDMVNSYNHDYPSRDFSWVDLIGGVLIFIFIIGLIAQ